MSDEQMAAECVEAFKPLADAAEKVLANSDMTLHDAFAGLAMAAYMVSNGVSANIVQGVADAIAVNAYRVADAMLAERKRL